MLSEENKETYIKAYSHAQLAKEWGLNLSSLQAYAEEHGWDREHKLYWTDQALEVLKKNCEEHNIAAVKELLRAMGNTRPVGRPSKLEVQRHVAIEAKIAEEYEQDLQRMQASMPLTVVK
jgi:hypothetical protein